MEGYQPKNVREGQRIRAACAVFSSDKLLNKRLYSCDPSLMLPGRTAASLSLSCKASHLTAQGVNMKLMKSLACLFLLLSPPDDNMHEVNHAMDAVLMNHTQKDNYNTNYFGFHVKNKGITKLIKLPYWMLA